MNSTNSTTEDLEDLIASEWAAHVAESEDKQLNPHADLTHLLAGLGVGTGTRLLTTYHAALVEALYVDNLGKLLADRGQRPPVSAYHFSRRLTRANCASTSDGTTFSAVVEERQLDGTTWCVCVLWQGWISDGKTWRTTRA